ncbi:unnamed protein product [Symbiodinium sp. CCMP2456]|nr:unnamed protein product [Symbiodinium sp. CCMP2456]
MDEELGAATWSPHALEAPARARTAAAASDLGPLAAPQNSSQGLDWANLSTQQLEHDPEIQQAIEETALPPSRGHPRLFKRGPCSACGAARHPHIFQSGRKQGQLRLLCNRFTSTMRTAGVHAGKMLASRAIGSTNCLRNCLQSSCGTWMGIKKKLRRTQLKGRSGKNKAKVDSLFGAFLLRSSGLHAVVAAVAKYRCWGRTSGVAPAQFFQEETLPLWLRQAK